MIRPSNKREERLVTLEEMRLCLSVKAFSTTEMCDKFSLEQNTIRKYMKLIPCEAGCRVYIETWKMYNLRWVPYYRYGDSDDMPMPRMTSKEKQAKQTIRRHNKKAGIVTKPAYNGQKRKVRPAGAAAWTPERIAARREERERAEKAAAIQPHMDPWASLFHGGAQRLAGVKLTGGAQA